jgi:hypothetical protein
MNDINFDPNIDQIVPIGFYTHPVMHRCNLIYPIKNETGWFFPKKWLSLKFVRVFYVFSPSILPLPPTVRMYYTIVKSIQPYNITQIKELTDPYDIKGLLNLKSIEIPGNKHKIGVFFGAFRKPVQETIPMYSYVKNTIGRSLYLHPKRNLPGNWISKFHFGQRIISPIFFLEKPTKFKIENNMCYPSKTGFDIDSCVSNLNTSEDNINELHDSDINVIQTVSKSKEPPTSKNNTCLILLIVSICIGILSIGIIFFLRNKKF